VRLTSEIGVTSVLLGLLGENAERMKREICLQQVATASLRRRRRCLASTMKNMRRAAPLPQADQKFELPTMFGTDCVCMRLTLHHNRISAQKLQIS
jgi:hypothetical protein